MMRLERRSVTQARVSLVAVPFTVPSLGRDPCRGVPVTSPFMITVRVAGMTAQGGQRRKTPLPSRDRI